MNDIKLKRAERYYVRRLYRNKEWYKLMRYIKSKTGIFSYEKIKEYVEKISNEKKVKE